MLVKFIQPATTVKTQGFDIWFE